MSNINCGYCHEPIPQDDYNAHVREKHAIPTVQDLSKARDMYYRHYAIYHPQRPTQASAASRSSSHASSSSDATLQSSALDSAKMSTRFSAWQEQNKFAVTQSTRYVTADDVSSFRVDRSDQPRMAAQSLQKATKYDIREFVAEFQELPSEDREKCDDFIRKLPVFSVGGMFRMRACFDADQVSELLYLHTLEIVRSRQAKVRIEISLCCATRSHFYLEAC